MRIILISAVCEFVLVACAIAAGAPVRDVLHAGTKRLANAATLCVIALACWVTSGLAVNAFVAQLPGDGRFDAGLLRLGDFEFNLVVLAPMLLVSLVLAYALAISLAAAAMGRGLRECVFAALRATPPVRSASLRTEHFSEP